MASWTQPGTGAVRRYWNDWMEAVGLEVERYGTGNVRYAEYRGERIANNRAQAALGIRVWLDAEDGLHVDGYSDRLERVGMTYGGLVAVLRAALIGAGVSVR